MTMLGHSLKAWWIAVSAPVLSATIASLVGAIVITLLCFVPLAVEEWGRRS